MFLERVADKILNTGKYLNVVRLCGKFGCVVTIQSVEREYLCF